MRLPPGSSVTSAAAAGDISRAKGVAPHTSTTAPADGIRISNAFETLTVLNAQHAVKLARVAAAVQGGTYQANSAAVAKAVVESGLS
jgi:hypothetical protein